MEILMKLAEIDTDELVHYKEQSKKTFAQLAEELLGDAELAPALRAKVRKWQNTPPSIPTAADDQTEPVLRALGSALVIADIHAPFQNTVILNRAIEHAKNIRLTQVDIVGDLHNFNGLSSHSKHEPTTDPMTDVRHARQILKTLCNTFDKIHITCGNHDEYWIKKRGGTFKELIYDTVLLGKYSDQVTVTNNDYMYRNDWIVGHLSNYDPVPGLLAAKIADEQGANIAVGHDHIRGMQRSALGYYGISIGSMIDQNLIYYKKRRLNTYPNFQNGYLFIYDDNSYNHFDENGDIL